MHVAHHFRVHARARGVELYQPFQVALRAVAGSAFFRAFYGARDIAVADLSRADYIEKRRTPWKLRPEKKKRAAGASREGADK